MSQITYKPGDILRETVQQIRQLLGSPFEKITIERVVLGLFFTGIKLSDGMGGLCFTPIKSIPEAVCCPSSARAMPMSGKLRNQPAAKLLDEMFHDNALKRALGIATLNALSMRCWQQHPPQAYTIRHHVDAIDAVSFKNSGYTVVVGALVPVIRELKKRNQPFGILELDKTTLKADELPFLIPPAEASLAIARADLLIITGTTLINDTLEGLLSPRKPEARVAVMGPTASGLPNALLRRGVSVIGGVLVTEPDRVLDLIAEGGSGYNFFGKGAERTVIQPTVAQADR